MTAPRKISTIYRSIAKLPLIALAGFGLAANAATVNTVGNTIDVGFNGIVNGNLQPGLTGTAHLLLTNIASDGHGGENWDFSITLNNTSTYPPISSSRISVLGFNTDPNVDKTESSASGVFNIVGSGNLAQVGSIEVCFKDGGSGNNCSGGGNGGVLNGTSATFSVRLNFNSDISTLSLNDFAVRYQSITGSTWGDSGAGVSTSVTVNQVPLPTPIALLGSALITLGLKLRKRDA